MSYYDRNVDQAFARVREVASSQDLICTTLYAALEQECLGTLGVV